MEGKKERSPEKKTPATKQGSKKTSQPGAGGMAQSTGGSRQGNVGHQTSSQGDNSRR